MSARARIEDLRRRIARGEYVVDAEAVASVLAARLQAGGVRVPRGSALVPAA